MRSRLPKRPPRPTFEVQDVVHHLLWSREVEIAERADAFELVLELPYLRGEFEARLAPKHYKKQMRALQARAKDAGPMSAALFSALAKLYLAAFYFYMGDYDAAIFAIVDAEYHIGVFDGLRLRR